MQTVDLVAFGQKVRKIRKSLRMTQAQVAKQIGVSQRYISNIENAKSVPTLQVVLGICNALQVMPSVLLADSLTASQPKPFRSAQTARFSMKQRLFGAEQYSGFLLVKKEIP